MTVSQGLETAEDQAGTAAKQKLLLMHSPQEVETEPFPTPPPSLPASEDSKKEPTAGLWPTTWVEIQHILTHIWHSMRLFHARVRRIPARQLCCILLFTVLLMAGNVMQILMLNFWLVSFPADQAPGNYTAFVIPGVIYAIFFLVVLGVYVGVARPNLRFARHPYGWRVILLIGFYDTVNSWLATYAASHTSEMLQSLFTNLSPLFAIGFSKWLLHDPRRYANVWIVGMFVLTLAGILLVVGCNLARGTAGTGGKDWFILLFFASIPLRVLMNTYQSLYMILYTSDVAFMRWLCDHPRPHVGPRKAPAGKDATEGEADDGPLTLPHQGEDTAVKLVMLAGETFAQMWFSIALLPADALPWFGGSATLAATWTNFVSGLRCFCTMPRNFAFGALYTLGFVFNYVGAAYVNHRSVTLCSLITQLSSPLTGLLLVMAPQLNALGGASDSWGYDVAAIVLLTLASLLYVIWEELTQWEMLEGERRLKMRKLHVRRTTPIQD